MPARQLLGVDVDRPSADSALIWNIDTPRPGAVPHVGQFELQGWVSPRAGIDVAVASVQVCYGGVVLSNLPVSITRLDVTAHFGEGKVAPDPGFRTIVDVAGLGPHYDLDVFALTRAGDRVHLCTLRGRTVDEPSEFVDGGRLRPLLLRTTGRAGSTMMMNALMAHPAIVGNDQHPHEVRPGMYWAHMFHVLGRPAAYAEVQDAAGFHSRMDLVARNPFWQVGAQHSRWFEQHYDASLRDFCLRATEGYYRSIAAHQNKFPKFFVEKYSDSPGEPAYPESLRDDLAYVFLVRDPRDILVSMIRFTDKRGNREFGRHAAADDADFARSFCGSFRRLHDEWRRCGQRAVLMRYEDAVGNPGAEFFRILGFLGLDRSSPVLDAMTAAARTENKGHMTSASIDQSVRAREDTRYAALMDIVSERLADVMAALGYR
jgi:hypothetical protein